MLTRDNPATNPARQGDWPGPCGALADTQRATVRCLAGDCLALSGRLPADVAKTTACHEGAEERPNRRRDNDMKGPTWVLC